MDAGQEVMAAPAASDEGIGKHSANNGYDDPDHDLRKKPSHAPMATPLRQKCGSACPIPKRTAAKPRSVDFPHR
jgi:hypothetical protein